MPDTAFNLVEFITQLVNSVGLPIAMICYFIYDKMKTTAKLADAVEKITVAINNQNTTLQKLLMKIGYGDLNDE